MIAIISIMRNYVQGTMGKHWLHKGIPVGFIWLLVICCCPATFKGINFICDEVPTATGIWFQEVPEEFYSNLLENLVFASVALYW